MNKTGIILVIFHSSNCLKWSAMGKMKVPQCEGMVSYIEAAERKSSSLCNSIGKALFLIKRSMVLSRSTVVPLK